MATHALTKPTKKNCVPEPVVIAQPTACFICCLEYDDENGDDDGIVIAGRLMMSYGRMWQR